MLKAKIKLTNPDDALATIEITATIKEWKELKKQLVDSYPSWQLGSILQDIIYKAEKNFYSQEDAK